MNSMAHQTFDSPNTVTVVVDAFRAFTTAAYVLEQEPATYIMTTQSSVIRRLSQQFLNPFLIGKAEIGVNDLNYDIPNSPTRVKETQLKGKHVFHRTAAGAKGILQEKADLILAAGFANADATVLTIKALDKPKLSIIPMGHEGNKPSLEDEVCAKYIEGLLKGTKIELEGYMIALKEGPGNYFFSNDQQQYPQADFTRCLTLRRFNYAIQANVVNDYAILQRCKIPVASFNQSKSNLSDEE